MKILEIMDIINEVENKFPVDEWTINNIHVWPIIRIRFGLELHNLAVSQSQARDAKIKIIKLFKIGFTELTGFLKYLNAYLKDHKKNSKADKKTDVVFLSDGVSYTQLNGYWYEKFCDPLIAYFREANINTFLMSPLHNYFIPRYSSSMFIQPQLSFNRIKARIKLYKETKVCLEGYQESLDYLSSNNLPVTFLTLNLVKKCVAEIQAISVFYEKIFELLKPRLAFQVSYYGIYGYSFNLACRRWGIPSADIQHGVQGDFHVAYGQWHKVPKEGYELLPKLFWCWSDREASAINKWSKKVSPWHRAIEGGNLFIERWLSGDKRLTEPYDKLVAKTNPNSRVFNILYTLNGFETNEYLSELIDLIKVMPVSCYWWLRCHPCRLEQKDEVQRLLRFKKINNANVNISSEIPLYALLRHIDLHITECSSTIIECEAFGIPSIVINQNYFEYYSEQIKSGIAQPVSAKEEIVYAVRAFLDRKRPVTKRKQFAPKDQALDELLRILRSKK